jgi:hypothetical protein
MSKRPLYIYVTAAAVVWAALLCAMWFLDPARFNTAVHICAGFFLGMLAMYIAVHFYRWK